MSGDPTICERRLKLFRNGSNTPGKVIPIPSTFEELLQIANDAFTGVEITSIYLYDGSLVSYISLLRDDDTIFAASINEPFLGNIIEETQGMLQQDRECIQSSGHCSESVSSMSDWINLNVGGRCFTTTRNTLVKYPDSMLARMFNNSEEWSSTIDKNGCYLIDRSPEYFEPLLNFLRHGSLILNDGVNPKGVLEEAKFFGLNQIKEDLESELLSSERNQSCVSRSEFMRLLMTTSSIDKLRCQGVNLSGADLSFLDLRSINFKYANLSGCNLKGTSLSDADFLLADLSHACLDDATMEGVQMKRTNLEGASMKNCKFECVSRNSISDIHSASKTANLEGANLKGVQLEGSQMSSVSLRLAILKGANMQNCVLREAVLAGADLENCNLTGADLQGANLRGANIVGTVFLDIVAPLHMVHLM